MLQDTFHSAERLDDVCAVIVQVPQLAVVPLMRPPERVQAQQAVLLEVRSHAPALVVREGVPVLLEQGVDAGDAAVPRIFEIFERQPPVLRLSLLPFQRVLGPYPLRVVELSLPGLDVPVEVRDELFLFVRHAGAEVRYAGIRLNAVLEIRLGNQDVPHGEHAESSDFFRGVENHWGETAGHLGVEPDLDAGLDLVLALDQQVEQLLRVHRRLSVVRHQPDERRVPLVHNLGERRRARRHQHLSNPVLKLLQSLVVHPEKRLRGSLLRLLVLQVPNPILLREVFRRHPRLGHDPNLEAAHVEQQVGVIARVHGDESVVPLERGDGPG